MEIKWYGQASFGIETFDKVKIVTDPYNHDTSGFKPFSEPADIVIKSSSNDSFHDNDHLVPKKEGATVIDALSVAVGSGSVMSHGITFKTIEAMEDLDHPYHDPDQNAMYRFLVDDINIGHMGDMGNKFSDEQISFFEGVDILLSHAGGKPVIPLEELNRIVDKVKPKLVIPMHFRTLCYKPCDMHFISSFIESFGKDRVDFACNSSVSINKSDIPSDTRALVLDYV
tara:strand:+ start:8320 stop:9000 length:681 start_codon:yes stop_codon:yes gene_type:complete